MSKDDKNSKLLKSTWINRNSTVKTVVIDSRQRNLTKDKTPSSYIIDLDHIYRNVTSVELRGAILPKSNYNIHSGNNKIDFTIGDFISEIKIIDRGTGYTTTPTVTISAPSNPGTTATAYSIIDIHGSVSNIVITNPGSGYIPSRPPIVSLSMPNNHGQAIIPKVRAVVGEQYTARLRLGEYDIGGNPSPPTTFLPSKLLLEIQNAMNYAVNGGAYDPISTGPFAVRVVSQYPLLDATPGTPESFDTNACLFNRIQVINTNGDVWRFLWGSGPNTMLSAASILGYNTIDSVEGIMINDITTQGGILIPSGTAIRGCFDYNLKNDPDYVILSLEFDNNNANRITSTDGGLNETFATLLFDSNNPETLHDLSASPAGSIVSVNGIQRLQGPTGKGLFWRDAGAVKPIKGYDFDQKKIIFNPPMSSISNVKVKFTKFGHESGGDELYYNMEGREHVLMFEFTMHNPNPDYV